MSPTRKRRVRLFIFDADGTLRRTTVPGRPCPYAPGEWELMPGVHRRLSAMPWGINGVSIGVASNQDHIAYGHLAEEAALDLLAELIAAAVGSRRVRPALRLCPHPMDGKCRCRKPEPGVLDIMAYYGATPGETLLVGDADCDREAARRAGVRFAWAGEFFEWSSTGE